MQNLLGSKLGDKNSSPKAKKTNLAHPSRTDDVVAMVVGPARQHTKFV